MTHTDLLLQTEALQLSEKDVQSHLSTITEIHKGILQLQRLGQLPFLDLFHQRSHVQNILKIAEQKKQKFDHLLLLGIGGSALGTRFLIESLAHKSIPHFFLCDSVDPDAWRDLSEKIDFKKTLVLVVSKSGRTIETLASYVYFQKILQDKVGSSYKKHLFFITDPKDGVLRTLAQEEGIESLDVPTGVGGRYSVLTPVGLFPAAFFGIDIDQLLAGGERTQEHSVRPDLSSNLSLLSAVAHFFHEQNGRKTRVILPYGERLKSFAAWFSQLWAESLGKKFSLKGEKIHTGTTPLCAIGPQDQHSQFQLYLEGPDDKVTTFVESEKPNEDIILPETAISTNGVHLSGLSIQALQTAERKATAQALTEVSRPHQTIVMRHIDPYTIGQLIVMSEMETIYSGAFCNINPFDQPAVELIKKNIPKFL